MKLLALDTATDVCSVALMVDDQILLHHILAPSRHAELILSMIEALLTEATIDRKQLDVIAFGCGPGSFMGVRIATGIVQGIAFAIHCPVIPISSLQAIAQTAYQEYSAKQILVGWDARMDAIYWGAYRCDEQGYMRPIFGDRLNAPEEIVFTLSGDWIAVGNAWAHYDKRLSSSLLKQVKAIKSEIYPCAKAIAVLAASYYRKGRVLPAIKTEPIYLRNEVAKRKDLRN